MQIEDLRDAYDCEERFDVEYPDLPRREASPTIVRYISNTGRRMGFVLWSKLDASTADAAIREQVDYFERIGQDFEWKVYDHDTPPDLKARLRARGFEIREPADAIMVLDLDAAPEVLRQPVPDSIRQITVPEDVKGVTALLQDVWQEDFSGLGEELAALLRDKPDALSVYAAYINGQAVSAAWTMYTSKSRFAGLWGGSTLPDYRKRGLYTGLLAVRTAEAQRRGIRFITVDASPMSRPILEKFGFVCIATATACEWKVSHNRDS